jgi:hypothetical protein
MEQAAHVDVEAHLEQEAPEEDDGGEDDSEEEEEEGVRLSYPVPRKRERSLHTCAQNVQITRIVTI